MKAGEKLFRELLLNEMFELFKINALVPRPHANLPRTSKGCTPMYTMLANTLDAARTLPKGIFRALLPDGAGIPKFKGNTPNNFLHFYYALFTPNCPVQV